MAPVHTAGAAAGTRGGGLAPRRRHPPSGAPPAAARRGAGSVLSYHLPRPPAPARCLLRSPAAAVARQTAHTVCSSSVSSWDGAAAAAAPAQTAPAESSETMQSFLVFLVELGLIAMGIVDTLMVGHVGDAALAAASLGATSTWLVLCVMNGLLGGAGGSARRFLGTSTSLCAHSVRPREEDATRVQGRRRRCVHTATRVHWYT